MTLFIQTPLHGILIGLFSKLFIFHISTVLWTLGIHVTQVLGPVYTTPLLTVLTENAEVFLDRNSTKNIFNKTFISVFVITSGVGITFGFILSILLL